VQVSSNLRVSRSYSLHPSERSIQIDCCPPLPIHTPGRRLEAGDGRLCECHGFGGVLEPRYIVGAESLDQ